MNTSRRGFLGSILGTYTATQLPWIARRALLEPEPDFSGYRSILVLGDGSKIRGPSLRSIERRAQCWSYIFEHVEFRRAITVCENILVSPDGQPINRSPFTDRSPFTGGIVRLFPGDRLWITHNLEV